MSEFARLTPISFALWQLFCLGHVGGQSPVWMAQLFLQLRFFPGHSDAFKCRLDRFFAGNIHQHRERRFFSRLNFVSNCFRSLQIDIGDRNPLTFSGKCFRNRFSNAGRRSG
jgi:hypothetical protein